MSQQLPAIDLLSSPYSSAFQNFFDSLNSECLICSPYITAGPVKRLIATAQRNQLQDSLIVKVITDISTSNLLHKSTDVGALLSLSEHIQNVEVVYLPRIHAKVYVSGTSLAVVSSANLTDGGSFSNLEYGIQLKEPAIVQTTRNDIEQYAELGGIVTPLRLKQLKDQVEKLRAVVEEERKSIDRKLRALSVELHRDTEDELLRARVQGRSINAIFADTILYLLAQRHMTTIELHNHIRQIHPDLCDDTLDRVIDGQHFGKLWKHQVRNAQQHLRRRGMVIYDANFHLWKRSA